MQFLQIVADLDRIEAAMAELYQWYGELFDGDREAAGLFAHLRMEEVSHRNILDYERRLALDNPDRFRIISMDLEALEATLEQVRHFRNTHPAPRLDEAVRTALVLERSSAELYYQTLGGRAPAEFSRFVAHLHAGCRTHFEKLAEFAIARGHSVPMADSA